MSTDLELKTVNDLLGSKFIIPEYQRGYRWTEQQVENLLNDIWKFTNEQKQDSENKFYCLQPVVVKRIDQDDHNNDVFEVIDGQQRLTTIYLVIKYLAKEFLKIESLEEEYNKPIFKLRYLTRPGSEKFLENIREDNSNIDYYYIYSAYKTIEEWFTDGTKTVDRTDKNRFLDTLLGKDTDPRSVQVIWYEAGDEVDSEELFTRLNIGKIPLTNAELIKALFLCESSFAGFNEEDALRKKVQIAHIWDDIEHSMQDEDFWAFITNRRKEDYATAIEMLFDIIARKNLEKSDPLYTFIHFLNQANESTDALWELWLKIEHYYLTLRQWYKEKNLYHKIGYLIATGEDLHDLITLSYELKKTDFEKELNRRIGAKVNYELEGLSYENPGDYKKISNVLLLFNVESIRTSDNVTAFYPFKFHKGINWSIEHIHAQNSEGLDKNKKEQWTQWLSEHRKLIRELARNTSAEDGGEKWQPVLKTLEEIDENKLTWEMFSAISSQVIDLFSEDTDQEKKDMHSLANLALLSQPDNTALSNSVFEVKRREIIKMDKRGSYIPICTRRVFLKYYNDNPSTQQYYYWGREDRDNYLREIKKVIGYYPSEEGEVDNDEE